MDFGDLYDNTQFSSHDSQRDISIYAPTSIDDEAFRVFMDKVHAEPPTEVYPAPQSIDDLKHFPQLLEKHRQQQEGNSDK
jgi:hypothetical protein